MSAKFFWSVGGSRGVGLFCSVQSCFLLGGGRSCALARWTPESELQRGLGRALERRGGGDNERSRKVDIEPVDIPPPVASLLWGPSFSRPSSLCLEPFELAIKTAPRLDKDRAVPCLVPRLALCLDSRNSRAWDKSCSATRSGGLYNS